MEGAGSNPAGEITECSSAWLERCVRDAEVVSSNLAIPIHGDNMNRTRFSICLNYHAAVAISMVVIGWMIFSLSSCTSSCYKSNPSRPVEVEKEPGN